MCAPHVDNDANVTLWHCRTPYATLCLASCVTLLKQNWSLGSMRGIIRVEWHRDPKGYDVIEQWGPSGACVDSIDRDYWRKYYDKPELWFVSRTCVLEQREKNAY